MVPPKYPHCKNGVLETSHSHVLKINLSSTKKKKKKKTGQDTSETHLKENHVLPEDTNSKCLTTGYRRHILHFRGV